jgi:hypothetical protein
MIMREPLESEYFNWLCAKVLDRHTRNTGMYYELLKILYTTEFIWLVPMDGNRAEDGIELREDFSRETHTRRDPIFESQPCSVFEVFLAFAKRASFQNDWPVRKWFWVFMENLQLDQFRQVAEEDVPMIEDILDRFLWRTYDPHGYGGLFPITRTDRDQRKIEIWWQFCEYVQDRGLI